MSTKLPLMSCAVAMAGILAFTLPAFAQSKLPAAVAAAVIAAEQHNAKHAKAEKGKTPAANKHARETAKNDGHGGHGATAPEEKPAEKPPAAKPAEIVN